MKKANGKRADPMFAVKLSCNGTLVPHGIIETANTGCRIGFAGLDKKLRSAVISISVSFRRIRGNGGVKFGPRFRLIFSAGREKKEWAFDFHHRTIPGFKDWTFPSYSYHVATAIGRIISSPNGAAGVIRKCLATS